MIRKIFIENFRGIPDSEINLGKINIFTDTNNSGKSSIIYGLLALKNVVLNSNQSLDSFLNLGFLNLGGFSQTVYQKDESKNILLGIETEAEDISTKYTAKLGKKISSLGIHVIKPYELNLELNVTFPHPANATTGGKIKTKFGDVNITWNGINPNTSEKSNDESNVFLNLTEAKKIETNLHNPIEELRSLDFIPLRRGFTKPNYSSSLLNAVAGKKLNAEDLKIFYLYKEKRKSIIESQEINEKGQIKGGLKSFYETELKEIKDFFQVNQD